MVRVCIFSLSPVRVGGRLQDVALRSSSPSAESPRNVIYSHGAQSAGPRAAGHRVRTGARVSCPFLRGCLFFWMGLCLWRGGHPPSLPRLSLPFPGRTSGSPQRRPLIGAEGDTQSDTESAAGHADGPSDGPQHVSRTQSGGFSRAHDPIQCTFPHVPMCIRGHPEDVTSPVTRRRARGTDSPPLA